MNHSSGQISLWNTQHAVRSLIRHQNVAFGIRRNDGCRTTFNQDSQLLFCFETRLALALDFMKVLQRNPAVAVHLANEESHTHKGSKVEHISG